MKASPAPVVSITLLPILNAGICCLKLDGNSVVVDTDAEAAAKQKATNADNRAYLKETDWYAIRKSEAGTAIPSDIVTKRAEARAAIVE